MLARITSGFAPIFRLPSELDDFFGDFNRAFECGAPRELARGHAFPPLNVWEDETTIFAEAELPGLKMDDLEVQVLDDELTIKGERKSEAADASKLHRRERAVGRFSRVLRLPVEVDAGKIEATLRDGMLTITMPKVEPVKPRKIAITGG